MVSLQNLLKHIHGRNTRLNIILYTFFSLEPEVDHKCLQKVLHEAMDLNNLLKGIFSFNSSVLFFYLMLSL